jgi:hypothetical protein
MAIVKVIDMAIVLHGLVTATGTVSMGMTFVCGVGLRHGNSPFRDAHRSGGILMHFNEHRCRVPLCAISKEAS